jgi:phage tail sheath protein FI
MPATLSYPGVYIEELPSGVRTITGVPTSIVAFVGRALRGPADEPVRIFSFADYERTFGGLWADSTMSFAVYQYFLNGGSDAVVVRLHNAALTGTAAVPLSGGGNAAFAAASPGAWAGRVRVRIDTDLDPEIVAANPANTIFNLRVKDLDSGSLESHRNLSTDPAHPRFATAVLKQASRLLRGPVSLASRPQANAAPAATATDPFDDPSATPVTVGANADGAAITAAQLYSTAGMRVNKQGLYQLEKVGLFNLLVIPPYTPLVDLAKADWDAAVAYARERRAMTLVDAPAAWASASAVTSAAIIGVASRSENAAMFFPRLKMTNPLHDNRVETFAPAGAVAGIISRTDASRGVWKSPAGIDTTLGGVLGLDIELTDGENGVINPLGVNCLRTFSNTGQVVWGARTLRGADALADQWKYLAVRRMALFLEESLYRGTQWVVFEPNDEPLWAQIRLNIGAFMQNLFRQGAFQGTSPRDAYFVRCDRTTTTQTDINLGIVNIVVGFAPLKPAEFVVIKLQQIAGDIPT